MQRGLKSALQATSASIRLTKKDNAPLLSLTIHTTPSNRAAAFTAFGASHQQNGYDPQGSEAEDVQIDFSNGRDRETVITQDVPIRVLSPDHVEGLHEPRCRDPDVHIILPSLSQLKGVSDRFTKLALASQGTRTGLSTLGPKLEMSANMHGCLKLGIKTDSMNIQSVWTGLSNPELDPSQVAGGEEGVLQHPSTRMKEIGDAEGRSEEGWATVRIDGKDWGKVMSVGRLDGRVIGCKSWTTLLQPFDVD